MDDFLTVKPGDPITAEIWHQLLKSVDRSNTLYGGENTRVTKTPHGTFVNAKTIAGWLHPWRVLVSRDHATVYPGLINGQKPLMLDKVTGNELSLDNRPPPLLPLNDNSFNNGVGYIALELTCDNKYQKITKAHVIQCQVIIGSELTTSNPYLYFGLPGVGNFQVRYPLARLQRVASQKFVVYQVAMFNLNWKAKPPLPSGGGTGATAIGSAFPRHFFWPA
jgi:hypothetical protein